MMLMLPPAQCTKTMANICVPDPAFLRAGWWLSRANLSSGDSRFALPVGQSEVALSQSQWGRREPQNHMWLHWHRSWKHSLAGAKAHVLLQVGSASEASLPAAGRPTALPCATLRQPTQLPWWAGLQGPLCMYVQYRALFKAPGTGEGLGAGPRSVSAGARVGAQCRRAAAHGLRRSRARTRRGLEGLFGRLGVLSAAASNLNLEPEAGPPAPGVRA
jgi:hypothetical protein